MAAMRQTLSSRGCLGGETLRPHKRYPALLQPFDRALQGARRRTELWRLETLAILDVAVNTLPQMDFNSRKVPIVFRDYSWQSNMSERHDARYGDLTSPLFGELAHVLDTNLKIVEQPLREGNKLLPRFSNRNLTRAAGEQRGAKSALNLLDSSRKRRLRRLQECGGGNEAAILRDSKNRAKLT